MQGRPSASAARDAVQADIARSAAAAGGEVGISATHLESGLTLSLNAEERFPMASTFKIAVAGPVATVGVILVCLGVDVALVGGHRFGAFRCKKSLIRSEQRAGPAR